MHRLAAHHYAVLPRWHPRMFRVLLVVFITGMGLFGTLWLLGITKPMQQTTIRITKDNWQHLPGVTVTPNGAQVTYTGLQLVKQDGTPGQDNPPLNVFGQHLQVPKKFSLSAEMQAIHGSATLALYSKPPVIADEMRIQAPGWVFTVTSSTVVVSHWQAGGKGLVQDHTFQHASADHQLLRIDRSGDSVQITMNGKQLGSVRQAQVLPDDTVWLGITADAPESSWLLANMTVQSWQSGLQLAGPASTGPLPRTVDGLQTLASRKRKDFWVGAAVASGPLAADTAYANAVLGGDYGVITPENDLKFQFVHPQPDVYTFQTMDRLLAIADQHGLAVHGHTLAFGEANPAWVTRMPTATGADKQAVAQVMVDHVTQVVSHYKGDMPTWDVINEPLADYDDFSMGDHELRNHLWYRAMGEDYIAQALRAAHAADPQAKLFINEYGLEADGERWNAMLGLLRRLQKAGVPVHGVGFQAHVYEAADRIEPLVLQKHILQLADMGLVARISEMDVTDALGVDGQAQQYAAVAKLCLDEPACIAFSSWGVTDRYNYFEDDDGSIQQGADFLRDTRLRPTAAYKKTQAALGGQ